MFNKLKTYQTGLNKTFVLNVASTIMLQGIAFFTVPIFSRILGTEQYGLYAIFNSWTSLFSTFLCLNMDASIISGRHKFKDEYYNYRNSTVFYSVIISIIVSLLCLILYPIINNIINYNLWLYITLLLTSFAAVVIGCVTRILIYEKKALLKFVISIFLALGNVFCSLFFIYFIKLDELYYGRVYGHLITYLTVAVFLIFYILCTKKIKLSKKYLTFGLIYGIPLIGHSLAGMLLAQSDRIMMQKLGTEASYIGIYSLYYSFTGVLNIILGAFNTSFSPFYIEFIDKNDKKSMLAKSKNYIELFTILCIGFLLLSREVSYIMADSSYRFGIELIPIFVITIYFTFTYHFPANYEFFYGKTKYIASGTICATIINIILNYFFILKWGMFGAAIASSIAALFEFLFHYIIASNMREKRFYVTFKHFVLSLIVVFFTIIIFYVLKEHCIIRWGLGILIGIIELLRILKRKYIF